jgi:uncharacterized protein
MILVRRLRLETDENINALKKRAAKKLRIQEREITELKLIKRSLDARKKDDIHYVCTAAVSVSLREDKLLAHVGGPDVCEYTEPEYIIPHFSADTRPVIVGFGPAGMFAALVLSYAGLRPIVIERGRDAVSRKAAVDAFRAGGALDTECNVQFGEGGAGTFSDGKLNTGTHDRRMFWVLRQFYAHGAPENVLYDAKPHIGTDILIDIVQNIRADVIAHGGEVRFSSRMSGLKSENGRLTGIEITTPDEKYTLPCTSLILAIGHSSRDTFELLNNFGLDMQPKPFSMGVRIEQRQEKIDLAQYGRPRGNLPAADYSLNVHLPDGESAYTFCMCPGGEVFAAASEAGGVVTNGMSYSKRDGENANSALLVTLHPEDFPDKSVLGGMYWQREIERAAYSYGGGNYLAPAQTVGDFLAHRASTGPEDVKPSYRPGVIWCELRDVLPKKITGVLEEALPELGKKLPGFDDAAAVMTAPETRSSSPVRIVRGETLESSLSGLYPCGEGAGYAGGISSAAVDGMRCAEAVIKTYLQN